MSTARSTEELTAIYSNQSAAVFMNTAMSVPVKDEPVGERKFVNNGCDWPCCNEQGECKPACWICLGACVLVSVVCCCYLTNGFDGRWTYWPF